MNPTQKRIAAQMLEMASDEFGNHISNDFELENTLDHLEFVRGMIAASDYPEEVPNMSDDGKVIYLMDWMVMRYCMRLLRNEATQ